jgi:DNA-binding NarL/FixJ family response regulator
VPLSGTLYLNPRLGACVAAQPAGPPDDLSSRELDVLRLIALAHTHAEIAAQLYLSTRTVETDRAHIQQNSGLSRSAAGRTGFHCPRIATTHAPRPRGADLHSHHGATIGR